VADWRPDTAGERVAGVVVEALRVVGLDAVADAESLERGAYGGDALPSKFSKPTSLGGLKGPPSSLWAWRTSARCMAEAALLGLVASSLAGPIDLTRDGYRYETS
jgi:hypothetical protein